MTGLAAAVVHARIAEQVKAARAHQQEAGRGEPEGVHQMRVALRRLRSALVTFRPMLQRDVTEPLRAEVKWLASELGGARDCHVMKERLDALVAGEPEELPRGAVQQRLDAALDREEQAAMTRLNEVLGSSRYDELMSTLDDLVRSPPWVSGAEDAGGKVLRKRLRHEYKRVCTAVELVDSATTQHERDDLLHEVRKAAKRARYAGESVESKYGEKARRFAGAMEEVQTILGDQHDAVIALDRLRAAGDAAHAEGESAFVFGRLHAREAAEADALVADFQRSWSRASRKKLRRWLG
jgi:CHAD domain-containing protein